MTRFYLRRRFRGEWGLVVLPILIFLLLLSFVIIVLMREPIILASFILGYIVFAIFLMRCVKKFYRKRIFLTVYRIVSHPFTSVLLLFTILFIVFVINLELYGIVLSFIWILASALFVSFVSYTWRHSLRREEHKLQTAWIYLLSQKFRFYPLLAIISFLAIGVLLLVNHVSPLPESVLLFLLVDFLLLAYYFFFLFISAFGILVTSYNDDRKYCEIGLKEVKKGLESCGKSEQREKYKMINIFIKDYLPIFPSVVDQFNALAESIFPDLSPRVPDSYLYEKALFASANSGKVRLDEASRGIKKMIRAIEVGKRKNPVNFINFIEGLCKIVGKTEFSSIPEAFETGISYRKISKALKKPAVLSILVGIAGILLATFSIYLSLG